MDIYDVEGENFCLYEKFQLPLYKRGLTWIGGINKDTDAAASNGSAKSTLLKAIGWCCWGECIDGTKGDRVIREGQRQAIVTVRLKDKLDGFWSIRRSRKKGSPKLELLQPSGEPWMVSKGTLQDKVDELLGLDFHAFKNTVMFGQNDNQRFARPDTSDAERKAILHRILRTDIVLQAADVARERARALRVEVEKAEGEIATLDARISEHDLKGMQREHDEWDEERANRIQEHKDEAELHKADAEAWRELAAKIDQHRDKVKKAEQKLKDARAASEKRGKAGGVWWKEKDNVASLGKELAVLDGKIERTKEDIAQLNGDTCPVCTTPLREGHAAEHRLGLEVQLGALAKERADLKRKIEASKKRCVKLKAEHDALNEQAEGADAASEELDGAKEALAKVEKADAEADRLIEAAKEALKRARDEKSAVNPYAARLKETQAKVQAYAEKRRKVEQSIEGKASELAHVEFWSRGFGGQGLPSFILDSVMPYLTERANHYLATLADGDITVNFSTQRELKSAKGEMRDEIEISWEVEGVSGYPPSGGQFKKIEIATDLALMDLAATREGAHLDLLMMDEVLDGVDKEGRERILLLLHELRSRRGSIFVISHEPDMAEIFERSITVVKEGGVSRLEVAA